MKMLKKLALVSAISMISAGAFAMEAMDDESMASATGQDGITILVKPGALTNTEVANMGVTQGTRDLIDNPVQGYYANNDNAFAGLSIGSIVIHDDDGLGTYGVSATANSGALIIGGSAPALDLNGNGDTLDAGESAAEQTAANRTVLLADGSSPIKIDVDMVGDYDGAGAGTGAMLNVKITTPRLAIKTGNIYVADSDAIAGTAAVAASAAVAGVDANGDGDFTDPGDTAPVAAVLASAAVTEVDGSNTSGKIKILSGLEIVMGAASTTIQLGSEAQGHMVVANTSLIGGLTINGLEVFDAGGTIGGLGTVVTTGGSLYVGSLSIKDAGGSNLTVVSNVDIGSVSTQVFNDAPTLPASTQSLTDVNTNINTAYDAGVLKNALATQSAPAGNVALTGTYSGYLDLATKAATPGAGQAVAIADKAAVDGAATPGNLLALRAAVLAQTQAASQKAYNGLVIEMKQFGTLAGGADVALNNIRIGDSSAATLGDVQILGLNINGTVAIISGH